MKKKNCWEFKQCGRGPEGSNDCPAARDNTFNGAHGGVHAGRACWVVAGTAADAPPSGIFALLIKDCLRCDFFRLVEAEEQDSETGFSATRLGILKMLQKGKPAHQPAAAPATGHIDDHLRQEFVREVNKMLSGQDSEQDEAGRDLQEEFAREVERVSSTLGKKSTDDKG